ncbi:uncharacterized protein EDB91DRAFT_1085780 [Suillus paluster]|uniref:uncharacterized protein n=1 Tax=Suillus paluster TaxID=48578 RepID=UPI001B85FAFD|nr:uncharacterized protein EDB91DRAFT_1085780 [Suillus paluster]KAG1729340.1 hypothetical protein EDB91DRAFT_1085780 [Suillus paluster]
MGDPNSIFESFQNVVFVLHRRWERHERFKFDGNYVIIKEVLHAVYNSQSQNVFQPKYTVNSSWDFIHAVIGSLAHQESRTTGKPAKAKPKLSRAAASLDEADELECLAGYGITTKEGSSSKMEPTLTVDDSDDELEIPAEFCALFTQPSEGGLSKASFAVSNLKRKASKDLDITPGSKIEDFSDNTINNTMDIDLPDKSDLMHEVKFEKPSVKLEKPPCTTSLTSVVITNIKPALTKKAKVELVKFSTSLGATSAKPKEQQSQYQNTDLPEKVQADHCWAKKFLPTMMLWAGSQESLWSIPDATLLMHIQIIFQAVYPELNLTIVQNSVVFSLTVQHLSEWQSNFSSTAIAIIFDFLMSNNNCDPELLGKAHLSAINSHAIIPTLKTKDLTSKGIAEGNIKVKNILASTPSCSKLNIKLPKVLNKATGKEISAPYLFSCDLWGKANTGYTKSIKKKGLGFIETTVDMVRSALNESTTMDAGISESSDDDRAFLLLVLGYWYCSLIIGYHSFSILSFLNYFHIVLF